MGMIGEDILYTVMLGGSILYMVMIRGDLLYTVMLGGATYSGANSAVVNEANSLNVQLITVQAFTLISYDVNGYSRDKSTS